MVHSEGDVRFKLQLFFRSNIAAAAAAVALSIHQLNHAKRHFKPQIEATKKTCDDCFTAGALLNNESSSL